MKNTIEIISAILFTLAALVGTVLGIVSANFVFAVIMFLLCLSSGIVLYLVVRRPAPVIVGRINPRIAATYAILDIIAMALAVLIIILNPSNWLYVTFMSLVASGDLAAAISNYMDYRAAKG